MRTWDDVWEGLKHFFLQFADNYVEYILQFILLSLLFYSVFKILKTNKGGKFIALVIFLVLLSGVIFSLSSKFTSDMLFVIICMIALMVFTMFNTVIKRSLLDSQMKKNKTKMDSLTVSRVDLIIE